MGTLDIQRPVYEKRLKIGARTLFAACLLMPFSATYMALLTFVIQLFNAVAQLYIAYDILKVAKKFLKDIRIMSIFFFLSICIPSVMEVFGVQFRDHTIYLAFIMLGLQSIILALHYNQSIIRVEQANLLLERKVTERTSELVKKEAETIELISSISHDLRAPISVVGGYMELLQKDASMNKASHAYISNSLVRLWQMEKLTLDLFTLSQISDKNYTLQLERIKITDTIGQIEMLYKEQAHQKGIELKINSEDLVCIADKMRLMQVLDNLVTNALSHASSTISISTKSNKELIEITVTDDGMGIHPTQLPYVFDRYYKNRQQGSGIGLSIVKDLVHRMNGVVTVESEQNVATSFIFTLPLLSDESHS